MSNVGIILGSTRPGRVGESVAQWVYQQAVEHGGATFELVDLDEFNLPHLDEPLPAANVTNQQYTHRRTFQWSDKVASFDAYVFVTPEYNHSYPGALKTAIDFVYHEWRDKAAGFVSYGEAGGARAVEHLRAVMGMLHVADVTSQVTLSLYDDFVDFTTFQPRVQHEAGIKTLLDEVIAWGGALKSLRS